MLTALAAGTLTADPVERTSTAGKPYATALMRVPCEDAEALLCSLIAFAPEAVRALMLLTKGDGLAVAGRGKLTSWEAKNGEQRHGLSVVADQVLSAYQVEKRRKAAREVEEPVEA